MTRLHAELGGQWALVTSADAPTVAAWLHDRLTVLTPVNEHDSMLVRPDGHLAWRGDLSSGGLHEWLEALSGTGRTR